MHVARQQRRCCRVINNNQTFVRTIKHSAFRQHHLSNIIVIANTQENDVAFGRYFTGGRKCLATVCCYPRQCACTSAVVDRDFVILLCEMSGHGKPHDSETAKPNAGHVTRGRLRSRRRLALAQLRLSSWLPSQASAHPFRELHSRTLQPLLW